MQSTQNIDLIKLRDMAYQKLLQEGANQNCFECNAPNPTFGDVKHAILLCQNCARNFTNFQA